MTQTRLTAHLFAPHSLVVMSDSGQVEVVLQAIRELMTPPAASRKRIGFRLEKS